MAAKRLYPRSTVKRIVKAHSNRNVSKTADILVSRPKVYGDFANKSLKVFLDYTLFIQE